MTKPDEAAGAARVGADDPNGTQVVRVLLVDDEALLRMGFRLVLEAEPGLRVVGEAADGADAVAAVRRLRPDVVLMDVRMPHVDGIEATRRILDADPDARVLILTTFDLDEYAFAALRAGASGFLLKNARPAELVAAVRAVAAGDSVVAPRVTRRLLDIFAHHLPEPDGSPVVDPVLASLSPRERQVLERLGQGMSNAEIAAELYLSETTVKSHVSHLLAKLGIRDRVQAVILAYERGIVGPLTQPPDESLDARTPRHGRAGTDDRRS